MYTCLLPAQHTAITPHSTHHTHSPHTPHTTHHTPHTLTSTCSYTVPAKPRQSGSNSSREFKAIPPQASVSLSIFLRLARRSATIPSLARRSRDIGSIPCTHTHTLLSQGQVTGGNSDLLIYHHKTFIVAITYLYESVYVSVCECK